MSPYVGTNGSPTYQNQHPNQPSLGIRPPPPSPQTPTQSAAAAHALAVAASAFSSPHYSPYMFPPSLYPYYSSHQQQLGQPSAAFSPTTRSPQLSSPSPISPFLVPNLPNQSASPSLSSMISNGGGGGGLSSSLFDGIHFMASQQTSKQANDDLEESSRALQHHQSSIRSRSSPLIDLTIERTRGSARSGQESPVDCSKQQHCDLSSKTTETTESNGGGGGLKRKGPSEDQCISSTRTSESSADNRNNDLGNGSAVSASRKHRLMKPPNINISDFSVGGGSSSTPASANPYRSSNGFPTSPFPLHSPLFAHSPHPFGAAGAGHLMSASPYQQHPTTSPYHHHHHHLLEHIPLSAPPMASLSHHSSPKFDFALPASAVQPTSASAAEYRRDGFSPSARGGQINSSKDGSATSTSLMTSSSSTIPTASSSAKLISTSQSGQKEMPSSIMKDGKSRKSSLASSECKVTFQVPSNHHSSRNSAIEGADSHKAEKKESTTTTQTLNTSHKSSKQGVNSGNNSRKTCQKYPEYFRKGSTIRLGNGCLKKVEELSSVDFVDSVTSLAGNGKFKVEQSEVLAIGDHRSKRGHVRITFLVGASAVAVSLESPVEHPFFVVQKGWSSCSPSSSLKRYGLQCQRLAKGDSVVTLASRAATVTPGTGPSTGSKTSTTVGKCGQISSPRSLGSSTGSLSSASSSSTSTTASPLLCPPPAHHLSTSSAATITSSRLTAALFSNSKHQHETVGALNLDIKSAHHHKLSGRSTNQQDEDEEIDVENVDESQS